MVLVLIKVLAGSKLRTLSCVMMAGKWYKHKVFLGVTMPNKRTVVTTFTFWNITCTNMKCWRLLTVILCVSCNRESFNRCQTFLFCCFCGSGVFIDRKVGPSPKHKHLKVYESIFKWRAWLWGLVDIRWNTNEAGTMNSKMTQTYSLGANTSLTVYCIILSWPYSEEGEVSTSVNAGDLKVAHYNFTVLVVFPQRAILLLQVWQGAQLVLCTSTY